MTIANLRNFSTRLIKIEQSRESESKLCDYTIQSGKMSMMAKNLKLRSADVKYPPLLIRSQNERLLKRVNRKSTNYHKIASRNSDESKEEQKTLPKKSIFVFLICLNYEVLVFILSFFYTVFL